MQGRKIDVVLMVLRRWTGRVLAVKESWLMCAGNGEWELKGEM